MKKKDTLFWKIFRWPAILLLHIALPFTWIGYMLLNMWNEGIKHTFRDIPRRMKKECRDAERKRFLAQFPGARIENES